MTLENITKVFDDFFSETIQERDQGRLSNDMSIQINAARDFMAGSKLHYKMMLKMAENHKTITQ